IVFGIIHNMPLEPDVLIWKNILSACLKHNSIVMGKTSALQAIEFAPEDSSYVLLSKSMPKTVGRMK
ncbi:pentatricopeptide repeat-containing protein, partial [Trifolium medium]|nr:pentatricopeptide repeat-containing protein [Trifolium medium]